MDLDGSKEGKEVSTTDVEGRPSVGKKDKIFRADKIDLKSLDAKLERHLSRAWSRNNMESHKTREEWEIDMLKLELKYIIARGTFGIVYRGTYDNHDVAVKLLDWGEERALSASETAALLSSFRQEVAIWKKLDHPNVTRFIGASTGAENLKTPLDDRSPQVAFSSRTCCVILEYLPGGTLKQFLIRNNRKKLSYKIVIQLALDLSRGLSYLHSKKIVHRDVKTENMLLDSKRTLKIADFGIARVEAQSPCEMTGETGTLGYMAPENLRPEIPRCCPKPLAIIMRKCWDANHEKRPDMDEVVRLLEGMDTSKGGGMIPVDGALGRPICAEAKLLDKLW